MKKIISTFIIVAIFLVNNLHAQCGEGGPSTQEFCFKNSAEPGRSCPIFVCVEVTVCDEGGIWPNCNCIGPAESLVPICHTLLPGEEYCFQIPVGAGQMVDPQYTTFYITPLNGPSSSIFESAIELNGLTVFPNESGCGSIGHLIIDIIDGKYFIYTDYIPSTGG